MHDLPAYEEMRTSLSKRVKVGQLFMPAAFINDTEANIKDLEELIRNHHIGGLCFFHSRASAAANFEGKKKIVYNTDSLGRLKNLIQRYQEAATYPLLIAIDAEWGLAMRVEHTPRYPYAATLGALKAPFEGLIYEVGLSIAKDCRDAGIHWNFSPVVDINTNPDNPVIGFRAFGSDPDKVLRKSRQMVRGLTDGGILSCLKHFPGHGDTAVDSHLELPVLEKNMESLETTELIPFRELIRQGAPAVMTGHLAVPGLDPSGLPASLSKKAIDLLRKSMGFDGVIVTDALNMHALQGIHKSAAQINLHAHRAGNDMLCFAHSIPESIDLILSGSEDEQLEASFQRIWGLKQQAFRPESPLRQPAKSWEALNLELARHCLAEIRNQGRSMERFRGDPFTLIYYGQRPDTFLDRITIPQSGEEIAWAPGMEIPSAENVLLALSPPSVKPTENFGLELHFLEAVRELATKRRVVMYLFGNPYLLKGLPPSLFHMLVCAFESLDAFQEAAALHFYGIIKAEGELSIDLGHG